MGWGREGRPDVRAGPHRGERGCECPYHDSLRGSASPARALRPPSACCSRQVQRRGRSQCDRLHTRRRRGGRPVLPARRQRRLRHRALSPRPAVRPGDGHRRRHGHDRGSRDSEPVAVQPRPRGIGRALGAGGRPRCGLEPRRRRADDHAERGHPRAKRFTTEIAYSGVPDPVVDVFGVSGFLHTDDGALVIGEPHVADTWYPVNDHPSDKAAYTFRITVPAGLEAVANGLLEDTSTSGGWTTWTWVAREPMASYLTTASVGEFELRSYKHRGISLLDAVDPDLYGPTGAPRTGSQFAISQVGEPAYKRLARTIAVPAGGANVLLDQARHGNELGSRVRRGPHRRRRRLDDAPRPERAHEGRHGLLVSVLARAAPVPRALPGGQRRRHLLPPAAAASGGRGAARARATSSGWSTSAATRTRASRCRSATPATSPSSCPGRSSTTSSSRPAPGRPRSRRTATRWTAGPCSSSARSPPNPNDWIVGTAADTPPARRDDRRSARPAGRDPRLRGGPVRPLPVQRRRRDRGRHVGDRLRAREPDAPDLREGVFHRSVPGGQRDRARAGPPVVRRQPRGRGLAAHLAQRGLRDVRGVALERA